MTKTQTTETSLQVSRVIKAPREKVYNAFLDSKMLAQWYHPGPMRTEVHKVEPQKGGDFRISMIADEGEMKGKHTAAGKFIELVPHEKIVHSWAWEGEEQAMSGTDSRVTVTLKEVAGGTEVTLLHEGLPHKQSVESHTQGWVGCLENLAAVF